MYIYYNYADHIVGQVAAIDDRYRDDIEAYI